VTDLRRLVLQGISFVVEPGEKVREGERRWEKVEPGEKVALLRRPTRKPLRRRTKMPHQDAPPTPHKDASPPLVTGGISRP